MSKIFGKLLKGALALALVLALAVPLQAFALSRALELPEIPASFEFAEETRLEMSFRDVPDEMQPFVDVLGAGEFVLNTRGVVVTEDMAFFMHVEADLNIPMLGMAIPVGLWVDIDISDLAEPTFVVIVEIPQTLRMMLLMAGVDAELIHRFYVLDLSEQVAWLAEEFEARILEMSPEDWDALVEDLTGMLEELTEELGDFEELMEEIEALLAEMFEEIMEEIGELITINDFSHDFTALDNGYSAGLRLDMTIADVDFSMDFVFSYNGEITNLNAAQRVPMPNINDENSLDIMSFIEERELFF